MKEHLAERFGLTTFSLSLVALRLGALTLRIETARWPVPKPHRDLRIHDAQVSAVIVHCQLLKLSTLAVLTAHFIAIVASADSIYFAWGLANNQFLS